MIFIGLGTGITAGALVNYKNLEVRDVFELLKEVKQGNQYFSGNYNITDNAVNNTGTFFNENVNIIIGDGRHSLLKSTKKYDLITLEPPPPTAAGVANLYSQDFYKLAKKHITKEGVVAQWWPITTQSVEASQMLVATMLKEFKYVTWWTTEIHETLLIGSNVPQRLDKAHIMKKLDETPEILSSLKEVGINNYNQLIATYLNDESALKEFAGSARFITDDYPALEFDDWTSVKVIEDIMPVVIKYQSVPPNQEDTDHKNIVFEQKLLRVFYIAATAGYMKQPEIWKEYMNWLYSQDSNNIYFNWFNPANES